MRTPSRRGPRSRPGTLTVTLIGVAAAVTVLSGHGAVRSAGPVDLVGYGSSGPSPSPVPSVATPATGGTGAATVLGAAFRIAGTVAGLYPGRAVPLVLTVTNPNKFGIKVTSVTTSVGNASSQCLAANVAVSSFSGSLAVGAGGTGKVTVTVTMAHAAPNACQGKVFPFHYTGSAQGV